MRLDLTDKEFKQCIKECLNKTYQDNNNGNNMTKMANKLESFNN